MRPEEYTDLRFNWLKRYIYQDKFEITDLRARDARQISESEYEDSPEGFRPLHKGDIYYTPDGTVFFEGQVTVPEFLRGRGLWLSLWTAAEVIVKVNGRYAAVWTPTGDRLLLPPCNGNWDLKIEMEGYNRSKPDDERNPDSMKLRGCRQEFQACIWPPSATGCWTCSMTCSCCWMWPRASTSTRTTASSSTGN